MAQDSDNTDSIPHYTEPVVEDAEDIKQNLASENRETEVPSEGAVDDRNTSEGQLINYDEK